MATQPPFPVQLLFALDSETTRTAIEQNLATIQQQEPVAGMNESLEFSADFLPTQQLGDRLRLLLRNPRPCNVIVASDQLTTPHGPTGYEPTDLARMIRTLFLDSKHLCGLVALLAGEECRTWDIDQVVDARDLQPARLKQAITKTANGLCLKAPPSFQVEFADTDAVKVQVVQSPQRLRECFALRHQVYGLMSYLEESVARCEAGIEMDSFDQCSIHFAAVDHVLGDVIGTARLVLYNGAPRYLRNTIIGTPAETLAAQKRWCHQIANGLADDIFREKLNQPFFLPLPILQSSDFKERWPQMLDDAAQGGEMSRVVVSPRYRGLGVSRLLIRAVIAAAVDLQKQFVLLECIPRHANMYAEYGFSLLEGHHCRAQDLDQVAVGMLLDLDDSPLNRALALARRDIDMIRRGKSDSGQLFRSKVLCLCNIQRCWKKGEYDSLGKNGCPLKALHDAPVVLSN